MVDNQKKYLDKVVDIIVRETMVDYDEDKIGPPFPTVPSTRTFLFFQTHYPAFIQLYNKAVGISFTKYCRKTYGIDGGEVEYVWNRYGSTIKDKIRNNGR
jgi:hypothetical protein